MSMSAFGVEHGEIYKAGREHDRQMSNTLAGVGGTSAAVGVGSRTVGHLEGKGKDPMGFTLRESHKMKPMVPAHRARVLEINRAAHFKQSRYAGGLAAGSLALAGAYKVKQKKREKAALSKGRKTDIAADTAAVGTGGAAIAGGGYAAHALGVPAYAGGVTAQAMDHNLRSVKNKKMRMGAKELAHTKNLRKTGLRIAGVKGAGSLAGVGVAGLGGKAIYDVATQKKKR